MILAFIGDNSFAREHAVSEFLDGFIGAHGSHAIDRISGPDTDFAVLGGAITTSPFLSQRRLVLVRDLSLNKAVAEKITELAEMVADTTDFVIVEARVDGRSKFVPTLRKLGDVREFPQLDGDALVGWICEQVKERSGNISRSDAQYIVDRVGSNQQLVSQEITKLLNHDTHITKASIEALTDYLPQSSIFAMLEAAFSGNTKRALDLYQEQRLQGMEPQAILGMIAWQLHILAIVKTGQDKDPAEIASKAKLNPFVVRKSQNITGRLSFEQLTNLLELATSIDARLKTVKINADDALTTLLIACSQ